MVAIKKFIRTNERIRVPEVRLIGPDGAQLGVMLTDKARQLAEQSGLDLVEVAPQASPPVCRIIDFSKFKYEQEKKERESRKHHKQELKEIRVKPQIDEHDYQVKLKQTINFLKKKDRVKIELFFKGRQIEHIDLGRKVLDRFIADTQEDGVLERIPVQEGKMIYLVVAPKRQVIHKEGKS